MGKYVFGVDLGGTTCKIGLLQEDGTLMEKWEIPTDTKDNGSRIIENIADSLEKKMQERQLSKEDILGIGLDVPGPVGADGIVSQCANLGWWEYPAAKILNQRIDLPVKIGNDANVAALGEMWQGGGKGCQDVVMITLGTGVGGGVILGGTMIAGIHGIGGEIGHITVNPAETRKCGCGKYGCLEQYASATGLVRKARELMELHGEKAIECQGTQVKAQDLTAKDIFDAAKEKNTIAVEAVEYLGEMFGMGLASVSCVIDPDVYVLGGGVSKAGDWLIEVVERHFQKHILPAARSTKFALATLGNDAGIYGCARMFLGE